MWRKSETESLESVKKDIKKIRRAGVSAEALGWLLLLFAAAVLRFAKSRYGVLILFGCFSIPGLFLIFTGKYLKDGRGRRTKLALLANSIVTFPLCVGILPIIACIQSANNYSRFKDLPENIQQLYAKPKPFSIHLRELIMLLLVLIIGTASIILKLNQLHTTAHRASTAPVQTAPKVNTAGKSHFTITFPSDAAATDLTEQVSGQTVSYTTYVSTANKGAVDYEVYAYNFPAPSFKYTTMAPPALATAVHNALFTTVQGLHGSIATSTPATFSGYPSEDAQFSSQTIGGTTPGYMRVFIIGNYEYAVFTLSSSQSEFTTFANSFQYKGN